MTGMTSIGRGRRSMTKAATTELQQQIEEVRREAYAAGYAAAMQVIADGASRLAPKAGTTAAAPRRRGRRRVRQAAPAGRAAPPPPPGPPQDPALRQRDGRNPVPTRLSSRRS